MALWGAGLGGFGSPIGGGMNLVAIGYIEEITGVEYMYMDWVIKMLPMLILLSAGIIIYMMTLKSEVSQLTGTRAYFREEYKKVGKMSKEETISGILFLVPIVLAFARPLFADLLPAFKPPYIFLVFGIMAFIMPGKIDGKLITWKYASPKMTWGLFYMLAGGLALGTFITKSGAAEVVLAAIGNINLSGGVATVVLFIALGTFLSNISSNTAIFIWVIILLIKFIYYISNLVYNIFIS